MVDEKKGLTGLPKNTAAALSYVLLFISGIVFLILEKDAYVRFHAMQSIVVFGAIFVLQWILAITIFLAPLSGLLTIVAFALWLILIYKAWKGEEWEVPYLGKFARKFVKKI